MATIDYVSEKIYSATRALAILPGDVRSRLYFAYLQFHVINKEDLPKELQDDFEWIIKKIQIYHKPPEYSKQDTLKASFLRMKNKTGTEIAKKIFDIYYKLNKRAISNTSSKIH